MAIGVEASVSALRVTNARHDLTSHDVANVNTPGFRQSIPYQAQAHPSGVYLSGINRAPNANPSISGTDLAEEAAEQISNKNTYSANLQVIKARDRMAGEVIDLLA